MSGDAKVHFVGMLPFALLEHGIVDHRFCKIVSYESRPDFLLDEVRFVGVKITQPYRVLQFPERGFDAPPGVIDFFDQLRGKLVGRKVCDKAFVTIVRESEPDYAERNRISAVRAVFKVVKGSRGIDEAAIGIATDDFGGLSSHEGYVNRNVEGVLVRKVEISNKPLLVHVLASEQKVLFVFNNVGHIVIRAIAPVADIDVFRSVRNGMSVNNGAEGAKLVLVVNRLQ